MIKIKEWQIALMALFGWSTIDLPAHLEWWVLGDAPHGMLHWIGAAFIACLLEVRWNEMTNAVRCRALIFTAIVVGLLYWIVL